MHKREKGNHIFDRLLEINSVNGNRKKWFMKKRILFLISKFIRKKSKANHKSILRNKKMHEGNGIRFARHISFVEPFFRCQNESSRVSGTRTKYWKKIICSLLCGANCKERNKKTCPRNGILFVSLSTAQNYSRSFHHLKHVLIIKFLPQRKIIVCGISLFV